MKAFFRNFIPVLLASGLPLFALADDGSTSESIDRAAIDKLLAQYRATQDAGDMPGQAKLMTPDRVWIGPNGERRTDNIENMRIQALEAEAMKKRAPGMQHVTLDHDVLVKFYASRQIAIVSFYRSAWNYFPPGTSKEIMEEMGSGFSETGTLVLEKQRTAPGK